MPNIWVLSELLPTPRVMVVVVGLNKVATRYGDLVYPQGNFTSSINLVHVLYTVGGNQCTRREHTRTWGEHANPINS